jgi:pimeloyl-ACP methyl ester carboxylesterase
MDSRFVDIDGAVHVVDFGGSGRPMLLVHGLGGSHVNWMAVGPRFAERFRVAAVDLRGYGRTPRAGHRSSLRENRALIEGYLEREAGEPVILAGNSMGGLLSMLTAAHRPDLVRALVLINPALVIPRRARHDPRLVAFGAAMIAPGIGEALMAARWRLLGTEAVVRGTFELVTRDPSGVTTDIVDAHLRMAHERRANRGSDRAFMQSIRSLAWFLRSHRPLERQARRISAPALLIHGHHDRLVALESARRLARLRPDWTFRELEHVGHVPMLEDPSLLVRLVEEWSQERALAA